MQREQQTGVGSVTEYEQKSMDPDWDMLSRKLEDGVKYHLPQEAGQGYCRRLSAGAAGTVTVCDFSFCRSLLLARTTRQTAYRMVFAFSDFAEYTLKQGGTIALHRDESYICSPGCFHGVSSLEAGRQYYGGGIDLPAVRFSAALQELHNARAVSDLDNPRSYRKFKLTPQVKLVLQQIFNCPYQDRVRELYLEGKVLELTAVYLNEMVLSERAGSGGVRLSQEDLRSLRQAKAILDQEFALPPTIAELSRMICLNEFKLKAGFKEVFGRPIYGYVLDRRLETARMLFEEKKLQVKEVASRVGYVNISHFSEAFRKKYGVTPGRIYKNN